MSRRRQLAVRESRTVAENIAESDQQSAPERPVRPVETPPTKRDDAFYRVVMMLWGIPLTVFIAIAVLKSQCGG